MSPQAGEWPGCKGEGPLRPAGWAARSSLPAAGGGTRCGNSASATGEDSLVQQLVAGHMKTGGLDFLEQPALVPTDAHLYPVVGDLPDADLDSLQMGAKRRSGGMREKG